MKQAIIMVAMIILGIFVFQMVAGDDETSIKSGISKAWEHEITERVRQEP